jgi:hypothetical protein
MSATQMIPAVHRTKDEDVTRPENAEQTEVQVVSKESESAVADPLPQDAAPPGSEDPSPKSLPNNGVAAPPQQRQRTATGDGDPKTVTLQVGASEQARGRAYGYSPVAGPPVSDGAPRDTPPEPDFSPSTVRLGGYTPPERVSPASPPNTQARSGRVPRRTSLQLQRLEPWSVLKLSLVLSVAGFLVWMVAVGVLYGVLAGMGVWDQINGTYSDLTSVNNPQVQGGTELVSGGRVFGVAMVIGLVNIVLMTALATVGSLIYNVAADFVGGVEVTLSEPD